MNRTAAISGALLAIAVLAMISKKSTKSITNSPIIPIKYGCNYVKFIGNNNQIKTYINKIIHNYFIKHPEENNINNINLINLTGFIVDNLSTTKECYILYMDRQLSKEQGLLLYTLLAYLKVFHSLGTTEEDLDILAIKMEELRKYLNIEMESDEKYQKIINELTSNREFYIL